MLHSRLNTHLRKEIWKYQTLLQKKFLFKVCHRGKQSILKHPLVLQQVYLEQMNSSGNLSNTIQSCQQFIFTKSIYHWFHLYYFIVITKPFAKKKIKIESISGINETENRSGGNIIYLQRRNACMDEISSEVRIWSESNREFGKIAKIKEKTLEEEKKTRPKCVWLLLETESEDTRSELKCFHWLSGVVVYDGI